MTGGVFSPNITPSDQNQRFWPPPSKRGRRGCCRATATIEQPDKLQFTYLSMIQKLLFTFSSKWCMILPNRVGDLALSATGTGSCPEDEGIFCDGVTAPAASYRIYLLYVATILGWANGPCCCFACLFPAGSPLLYDLPDDFVGVFYCRRSRWGRANLHGSFAPIEGGYFLCKHLKKGR